MKIAKAVGVLVFVFCSVICGHAACAAGAGWYMGMGLGQSRAIIDNDKITNELRTLGVATAQVTAEDDHSVAFKFYGGYQFTPYIAVEAGYFNLGKYRFTATTTAPAGTLSGDIRPQGLNLDAVGTFPLIGKFSVLARLGVLYADPGDTFVGTGGITVANSSPTRRETNVKYGLGGQYNLTTAVGLRGEWERYRSEERRVGKECA